MTFPEPIERTLRACIARHGRAAVGYDPARPPVAVFDWDNTCAFNDVCEGLFDLALRTLDAPIVLEPHLAALLPETVCGRDLRRPALEALTRAQEQAVLAMCAGRRADAAGSRFRYLLHAAYLAIGEERGTLAQYAWIATLFSGLTDAALEGWAAPRLEALLREPIAAETLAPTPEDAAKGWGPVPVERGLRRQPGMTALRAALEEAGWEAWVVSASPAPLVRAMARGSGFAPERVLGLELESDPSDERLLPRVREPLPYAEGKVAVIDARIGRRPHLVVGDSAGDVPMLRASLDARLVVRRRAASAAVLLAEAEGWPLVEAAAAI